MSSDKVKSTSETWAERYDDRDAEDLVCERWSLRMAQREQAMANPIRDSTMAGESGLHQDGPEAANEPKPDK